MPCTIFQSKKKPFQAIKTRSSRSRKIDIFPKGLNHGFGPKIAFFGKFFFFAIIGQENVFYDILQRKNSFLGYKVTFTIFQNEKMFFQAIKRKSSKSRKIDIFSKGLTHGFGPKMADFPTFFFQAIQARKMSFTIFQNEKTTFQAIKTTSSKSRKIDIFPKGLPMVLVQKWPFFQLFFFRQYRPEKCLL